MKRLVILMMVFSLSQAFAMILPDDYEKPILSAYEMEVSNQVNGFQNVVSADLTLTQRGDSEEPTGMIVSITTARFTADYRHLRITEVKTVELEIYNIEEAGCGSITYMARAKDSDMTSYRFNVALTSHAGRLCRDYKPYMWEAQVVEGYGFCGTLDARMTLSGNPEPVFVIE